MADKKNKTADSKSGSGAAALKLQPLVDISRVEPMREAMLALLESPEDVVVVDGSAVERVTTPGIQLLLALEKALAQRGNKKLVLADPSRALQDVCAALGLSHKLQEWSAA